MKTDAPAGSNSGAEEVSTGLSHRSQLPVRISVGAQQRDAGTANCDSHNELLLRASMVLLDHGEPDDADPGSAELNRLELRIQPVDATLASNSTVEF